MPNHLGCVKPHILDICTWWAFSRLVCKKFSEGPRHETAQFPSGQERPFLLIADLFMETHPDPEKALSDGPNAWPLGQMKALLENLLAIDRVVKAGVV